jgi:hypothetical protein
VRFITVRDNLTASQDCARDGQPLRAARGLPAIPLSRVLRGCFTALVFLLAANGLEDVWGTACFMVPAGQGSAWHIPQRLRAQEVGALLELTTERLEARRLLDITPSGQFLFATPAGPQTVAPQELIRWRTPRPPRSGAGVWLNDGSWLAGPLSWLDAESVRIENAWLEPVTLKLDELRGVVFSPPRSLAGWLAFEQQLATTHGASDVVWLVGGERLSGLLRGRLDPEVPPPSSLETRRGELRAPGFSVAPAAGEGSSRMRWSLVAAGGAEVDLPPADLRAVLFSPVLRPALPPPSTGLRLDLRDGSTLFLKEFRRTTNGRMEFVLRDGRTLSSLDDAPQFATGVEHLSHSPARITWLSSLEPARYRHAAAPGGLQWPLGVDRDLYGQPFIAGGDWMPRGLALHAPAQVAYRHDGSPARLVAELSVQPRRGDPDVPVGSARFKVLLARSGQLEEAFDSGVVRAGAPARWLNLDVGGAQLIALVVEEAELGTLGDHGWWRGARLVRLAERE